MITQGPYLSEWGVVASCSAILMKTPMALWNNAGNVMVIEDIAIIFFEGAAGRVARVSCDMWFSEASVAMPDKGVLRGV